MSSTRVLAILSAALTSGASAIAQQTTEIASVNALGQPGNEGAYYPSFSEDGHFVVFNSGATNLIPGDQAGTHQVYCRGWQAGTIELVSINSAGKPANGGAMRPAVSADGRWVAFESTATNLVVGDGNGTQDIFVRDRQMGAMEIASVDSSGNLGNGYSSAAAISADGSCVAFQSFATNLVPGASGGVFVHVLQTGVTELVSVDSAGNPSSGDGIEASISGDGRLVAFSSSADDLVANDTNGWWDVFVHDRQTGITERVSVASSGAQANGDSIDPSISGDGRHVAFHGSASNLSALNVNPLGDDVFVHDRQTGVTELVSIDSFGTPGNGISERASITADGRYVAFESSSDNLVQAETNGDFQIFVRDRSCIDAYVNYCTPGTSANGCEVELIASGVASSSASSGFVVTALSEAERDGLFFYGQNGRQAAPWGNGTSFICVIPPVKRAGLQPGNGTPGACDAIVAQDLNAWWCSTCPKPNGAPLPSKPLQIQFWYRDPASTSNQTSSLSDAIEVTVCP